jgi:hypothetical protein
MPKTGITILFILDDELEDALEFAKKLDKQIVEILELEAQLEDKDPNEVKRRYGGCYISLGLKSFNVAD